MKGSRKGWHWREISVVRSDGSLCAGTGVTKERNGKG